MITFQYHRKTKWNSYNKSHANSAFKLVDPPLMDSYNQLTLTSFSFTNGILCLYIILSAPSPDITGQVFSWSRINNVGKISLERSDISVTQEGLWWLYVVALDKTFRLVTHDKHILIVCLIRVRMLFHKQLFIPSTYRVIGIGKSASFDRQTHIPEWVSSCLPRGTRTYSSSSNCTNASDSEYDCFEKFKTVWMFFNVTGIYEPKHEMMTKVPIKSKVGDHRPMKKINEICGDQPETTWSCLLN